MSFATSSFTGAAVQAKAVKAAASRSQLAVKADLYPGACGAYAGAGAPIGGGAQLELGRAAPRAASAAPSPAPVCPRQLLLLSGDAIGARLGAGRAVGGGGRGIISDSPLHPNARARAGGIGIRRGACQADAARRGGTDAQGAETPPIETS